MGFNSVFKGLNNQYGSAVKKYFLKKCHWTYRFNRIKTHDKKGLGKPFGNDEKDVTRVTDSLPNLSQ